MPMSAAATAAAAVQQNSTEQQQQKQDQLNIVPAKGIEATISLLLQYNIDNTLNAYKKEHKKMTLDASRLDAKTAKSNNNRAKDINRNNMTEEEELQEEGCGGNRVEEDKSQQQQQHQPFMPPTPPTTPNLQQQQNTAQKRWRILAKVLRKDSEETVSSNSSDAEFNEEQTASVRRFKSFDLLRQDSFEDHVSLNCLGKSENWYKYRMMLLEDKEYSVNIHHMERQLTASDLMGFNNTGNICVWPSEEALTALVLSDVNDYTGKWILELGGGFTSLAGLMLAKYAKPYAVHLTDGNEISVENVRKTVCLNELSCYTKCSVLKWQNISERSPDEHGKFEYILCADCLFFDEARSALVDTIWYYLAPQGVALIMAPRRGRTLNVFQEECLARGFRVDISTRYNETIWKRHLQLKADSALYDEDLHYPVLLRVFKSHS